MGMYTELIFGAELKSDTPADVIGTLEYMCGNLNDFNNILFEYPDIFKIHITGFPIDTPLTKTWIDGFSNTYRISVRCQYKNYHSEIENFLGWIKPFIKRGSGNSDMYAITIYEDSEEPMIYYLNDNH